MLLEETLLCLLLMHSHSQSVKRRQNSVNLLQQTKMYCSSLTWGKKQQQQQMTGEETDDGHSRDITMTYTLISQIWQNTKQNKNITMGRVIMASFIAMKAEWRVLYSNLHYIIRKYDQIIIVHQEKKIFFLCTCHAPYCTPFFLDFTATQNNSNFSYRGLAVHIKS